MTKRYKVGVAGVVHGHLASRLPEWKDVAQADVVAIADPNEAVRQGYVDRYELGTVRQYDAIEAMLASEELDIVGVFTETARHAAVVEAAAARRLHCLVEKPLAVSLADAERMYAAAGKFGVQVLTNYPLRWGKRPEARAIRFAADGGIGRVYEVLHRNGGPKPAAADANTFFQWLYRPESNGAGAFADFGCYGADLACDLLGQPAAVYAVAGRWARNDLLADDNARMVLTYHRGVALVSATWTQFGPRPATTLFAGETGTVAVTGHDIVLYNQSNRGGRALLPEELPPLVPERTPLEHLVRCLEEGRPAVRWAGVEAQRGVTEVLDAGLRSIATGAAVHLPVPLPTMFAAR